MTTPMEIVAGGKHDRVFTHNITEEEVLDAQRAWGDALVKISVTRDEQGEAAARALAADIIRDAYDYQRGIVLFKPTLAYGDRSFRTTFEGALSYFVGGNADYPEDKGFAFSQWRRYEIRNGGIIISGETAITQGHVLFTNEAGVVTKVDKTWGFRKDDAGRLRINLHHSSLVFNPDKQG